jgi:hypothetical protein
MASVATKVNRVELDHANSYNVALLKDFEWFNDILNRV